MHRKMYMLTKYYKFIYFFIARYAKPLCWLYHFLPFTHCAGCIRLVANRLLPDRINAHHRYYQVALWRWML